MVQFCYPDCGVATRGPGAADPLDEISQATIDLRAPCPLLGFPAPESFPARAMPPKDRLRLNDLGGTDQARPEPVIHTSCARSLPRSRRRGGGSCTRS